MTVLVRDHSVNTLFNNTARVMEVPAYTLKNLVEESVTTNTVSPPSGTLTLNCGALVVVGGFNTTSTFSAVEAVSVLSDDSDDTS